MKAYQRKKSPILDELDQSIIRELQKDARQSYLSLGQKLDASEGTIRNRVGITLKKELFKLKAVVNPDKLGLKFSCVVGLEIDIDKLSAAEAMLSESQNVFFLSGCTGAFDLFAIMYFRDTHEFDQFVRNTVSKLPGIKKTQTFVNMRVIKDSWSNDTDFNSLLKS